MYVLCTYIRMYIVCMYLYICTYVCFYTDRRQYNEIFEEVYNSSLFTTTLR